MPHISTRTFSQQDILDFGFASGGTGLIHTDPEYAGRTRFGRTLVQGLFLLAVVEEAVCRSRPDWDGGTDVDVSFVAPVGVGDTLTVRITPDPARADLADIEATTENGVVLRGSARPSV